MHTGVCKEVGDNPKGISQFSPSLPSFRSPSLLSSSYIFPFSPWAVIGSSIYPTIFQDPGLFPQPLDSHEALGVRLKHCGEGCEGRRGSREGEVGRGQGCCIIRPPSLLPHPVILGRGLETALHQVPWLLRLQVV